MGDIPIAIMSYRYRELVPEHPAFPNFERWYAAIAARPAFKGARFQHSADVSPTFAGLVLRSPEAGVPRTVTGRSVCDDPSRRRAAHGSSGWV